MRDDFFFTYNSSIAHPYFAPREGFVRFLIKNQGMVGKPGRGKKGKRVTTLTWLV